MNDLQIEYFLTAAENLSFTKTANELYVSQPAVSKQISALEAELEVALFERGYRSTKLTPAGRMYFNYFTKHLAELKSIKKWLREDAKNTVITLRIGCGSGWTLADILPGIVAKLDKIHGGIRVHLENCAFNSIVGLVNENEIDVGITLGSDVLELPTIEVSPLLTVPRGILYSKRHPLTSQPHLVPSDFKNEWFLVPQTQRSDYITDLVNSFCEPYNFSPELQEVRNTESMLNSVSNGLGVAIADYWTYQTVREYCAFIPLDSVHTISAMWRKNNKNPLTQDFMRELKAALGK